MYINEEERKELEKEEEKLLDVAKEMVEELFRDIYGEEEASSVKIRLRSVTCELEKGKDMGEGIAFFDRKERKVLWNEEWLKEYKGTIMAVSNTIHELAHSIADEPKQQHGGGIIDEAMANLLAEMCINNYLQKGKEIPRISKEENEKLEKRGFVVDYNYRPEANILKSILGGLRTKGRDLDAIKEFFVRRKR